MDNEEINKLLSNGEEILRRRYRESHDEGKAYIEGYVEGVLRGEENYDELLNKSKIMIDNFYKAVNGDYNFYLQTNWWKKRSKIAKAKAGFRCQLGRDHPHNGTLEVHHNNYENLWDEKDEDLICLCQTCHSNYHKVSK